MDGSFLKHTNVELLRLATYLARRDVAVGQIQRCNLSGSGDFTIAFDEPTTSQTELQEDEVLASIKSSVDLSLADRKSACGALKTSVSVPLRDRTRSELSSASHPAQKEPPVSARSLESLPRRTFSPPVRDTDGPPSSRRKPLHEPTERRLMAAEVSRLRQLIMKSKRALEYLDSEILVRKNSRNCNSSPRSQPLPLSVRGCMRKTPSQLIRLRPKSAKTSLLKPCAVPLKFTAQPPRKHTRLNVAAPTTPRKHVYELESSLRRPLTAGTLGNSPAVSEADADRMSLQGDKTLLSWRSETHCPSVRRGRPPQDMALLSAYLKRLSTGSTQCFEGSTTTSPRRQPLPSNVRPTGGLKYSGRSAGEGQDRSNRLTPRPLRQQKYNAGLSRVEEEFVTKWGRRLDYIVIPPSPSILQSSLSADESVTLVSQDSVDVFLNRHAPPPPKQTLQCKPRVSATAASRNAQFSLIPNEDDARLLQPQFNDGLLFMKRPIEAGDVSQQDRFQQVNATASSTPTQQVLRLPDSLHKRLLAGSNEAQAAHRRFWQVTGLQETATGVCLHSVFDWLVQDIVSTCVDGVVNSLETISDKLIDNLLKHELDSSSVENSEAAQVNPKLEQTRPCGELFISTTRGSGSPASNPPFPCIESRAGTSAATIAEGDFGISSREVTPVPFDHALSPHTSSQSSSFSCLAFSLKNDADEIVQEVPEELCAVEPITAPGVQTLPSNDVEKTDVSRPGSITEVPYLRSSLCSDERRQDLVDQSPRESGCLEIEEVNEDLPSAAYEETEVVGQGNLSSSAPKRAVCVSSTPRQLDLPLEPKEVDIYSADFDESTSDHSADSTSRSSSAIGEVNWGSRTSSGSSSLLSLSIARSVNSENSSSR
uniref:Uncharacterized protein n=1 Tax=Schistocephalus solidus TaxID=70667 RepID=A0A0X3PWZ8_SCHSO